MIVIIIIVIILIVYVCKKNGNHKYKTNKTFPDNKVHINSDLTINEGILCVELKENLDFKSGQIVCPSCDYRGHVDITLYDGRLQCPECNAHVHKCKYGFLISNIGPLFCEECKNLKIDRTSIY
jgi:hypothetical protein